MHINSQPPDDRIGVEYATAVGKDIKKTESSKLL